MTLNIRLKELDFFKNCFKWMGGTAALLAGFAYGEISTPMYTQIDNLMVTRLGYEMSITIVMGLGLIIIVQSSFCNIFGSGLALRGSQGSNSVDMAVRTMGYEFNQCLMMYLTQLLVFMISLFFKVIILHSFSIAMAINVINAIFCVTFVIKAHSIFQTLHVEN